MDLKAQKLVICYENADLLVVNKPTGLLVHPVASDSVALTQYLKDLDPGLRPAHRLDRETSGCVACGRGPVALRCLGLWFMRGQVGKSYRALVSGTVQGESGLIDAPLLKHNARMVVHEHGQSAQSKWRVLERRADETLLELEPLTGRTHQLRVHMAHLGHPIIGDKFYGGANAPRLWLHAYSLQLPTLPLITSPLPAQLASSAGREAS
jgi:tRNA pseudouridine32 synthase / 23S rRNA pseudouridine746 synthase